MPVNEQFHIHISVNENDDLIVERVYQDGEKENDLLCTVALTAKDDPDYDPVFGDHTEVVVEAKEMRMESTTHDSVIVIFGL